MDWKLVEALGQSVRLPWPACQKPVYAEAVVVKLAADWALSRYSQVPVMPGVVAAWSRWPLLVGVGEGRLAVESETPKEILLGSVS